MERKKSSRNWQPHCNLYFFYHAERGLFNTSSKLYPYSLEFPFCLPIIMRDSRESNTVQNILRWATATLKKSNIETPHIDAESLLAYTLSCDRSKLHTSPEKIIKDDEINKYEILINQRASHTPLQYIIGHVEFMSLDFFVDKRALIPRQETEILVETVLTKAQDKTFSSKRINIIEIGIGCGNIAISLAVNLSNVQIYSCDISKEALALAKLNVQKHKVANRIHLLHGKLFDAFDGHLDKGSVDFVVSNPPYVSELEWNLLEPEIRNHEPLEALVGGKDGLYYYKQIIKEAPNWLKPKGLLILEVGETQAKAIIKLIENENLFEDIKAIKDLQKKERIVAVRRK